MERPYFPLFTFTQLYFEKCQICIFLFTVNIAAISDVPVCATSEPVIYGVSKNERVDIVCRVASNPSEVQFRWTFNNSAELIRWVVTSTSTLLSADLGINTILQATIFGESASTKVYSLLKALSY